MKSNGFQGDSLLRALHFRPPELVGRARHRHRGPREGHPRHALPGDLRAEAQRPQLAAHRVGARLLNLLSLSHLTHFHAHAAEQVHT